MDAYIVQATSEAEQLRRQFPNTKVLIHPHPVYNQFPETTLKTQRKADLHPLFFGFVRRYKGLDLLIRALAGCMDQDWHLTVAGEFWEDRDFVEKQIVEFQIKERVDIDLSPKKVAIAFRRFPIRLAQGRSEDEAQELHRGTDYWHAQGA